MQTSRDFVSHFASQNPLDIIKRIREGLPYRIVLDISIELGINQQDLSRIIGLNERTLARRRVETRFHPNEGDRLYRLTHLYLFAVQVFKVKSAAIEWLKRPKAALGGEVPLNLLDTDVGVREVENLLGKIEYGVYS